MPARTGRLGVLGSIVAGALLVLPAVSHGANFTVTNTTDAGDGSLRQAILDAGGNAEADTITITATGTITLSSTLGFNDDLTIIGPGSGSLAVDGDQNSRVFTIAGGNSTIADLTVTGGLAFAAGSSDVVASGGGIENDGDLTLVRVVVSDNIAQASSFDPGNSADAFGGGVSNLGLLTVRDSTFTNNRAIATTGDGGGSPATAQGGAIFNNNDLVVDRSTFDANIAGASVGTITQFRLATGGAIHDDGDATLRRSTITGNLTEVDPALPVLLALSFGGGVSGDSGTVLMESLTFASNRALAGANFSGDGEFTNTIVADPDGPGQNCVGGPNLSLGHNLEDGDSCGFAEPTDRPLTNPRLDPSLSDNGGPTQTLALLAGSPALDAGIAAGGSTDQRALSRPSDLPALANVADGSDIGAYEEQVPGTAAEAPRCRGLEATIVGTDEGETIAGTGGIDVIVAGGGNDAVRGLRGNDVICGGDGRDRIRGGSGFDKIEGQRGRDRLIGGSGRDKLFGHQGRDRLNGNRGKDTCTGGKSRDTATGCEAEVSI